MAQKTNAEADSSIELIAATLMFLPLMILGYQAYCWLRTGEWLSLTVRHLWIWTSSTTPTANWTGVQKIIDGLLSLPLSLASFAFVPLGFWIMLTHDARKRR